MQYLLILKSVKSNIPKNWGIAFIECKAKGVMEAKENQAGYSRPTDSTDQECFSLVQI